MPKCVIIGSGLGGLSCGCILAKNGYDVTVLEKGDQIGGNLQCFRRGGVLFETGMHYIGSAEPGQVLHSILHYLGVDADIRLARLNPAGYDVVSFQGEHYHFANGKEDFVNTLAAHFPKNREELERYFDLVKMVASSSPMHSLSRDVDMSIFAEYQTKSVNAVIDSVVSNPLLRQVLAGILPLYAGEKDRTPFVSHALIADSYSQSAFRVVGGSHLVAQSLADSIRRFGGRVLTRHKASRIVCDERQVTAVVTADGEHFAADYVISAIHPACTIDFVDSHLLRPAYRQRIAGIPNTTSAFTLYLKFRKNSVRYMDSNLYHYRGNSTWGCEHYDEQSWPKYLLYMHFCHEENPVYAEAGEVMTYMNFDEVSQWVGTRVGQRGEAYEEFKRKKAEKLINALEEEVPGIRQNIEQYYTSTPLTYLDYTDIPGGSMYGIAKDVNAVATGSVSCKTSIPNLFLAGQSIVMHGMLGVLAGSLVTCSEFLTTDEIFSQIKNS